MRLLSIGKQFDQTTQLVVHEHVRCSEREKTVVLERMVVDPGVHGRGLGSACLTAALASQATAPVVLSTQLQRDVEFYSRIGFHVVLERQSQSQIRSCCRHCRHNQS
jgi:N-acetylglutamate synthase-like GNAT family acetyltransferase